MTTFTVLTPIIPTLSTSAAPVLTFTSAAANQVVPLSSTLMTMVFIKNTSTTQTVTFTHHKTGDSDEVVSAPNGTTLAGVWLPYRWANTDSTSGAYNGCEITWGATANMSIAVVQVPYASK